MKENQNIYTYSNVLSFRRNDSTLGTETNQQESEQKIKNDKLLLKEEIGKRKQRRKEDEHIEEGMEEEIN